MARIIWTEPALQDLDEMADYISLDKPEAARSFVQHFLSASINFRNPDPLGKRVSPSCPDIQTLHI